MVDPLLAAAARLFLGSLLLFAGLHKATQHERFKAAMTSYRLLPDPMLAPAALLLTAGEIAAALLLVTGTFIRGGAVGAILILGLYFLVLLASLAQGRNVDCGCSFSRQHSAASPWHLLRIALLISLAAVVLVPDTGRPLAALDLVQLVVAVASAGLIYLCADALLTNRSQLLREKR